MGDNHNHEHGYSFADKLAESKYGKILWFCLWSNLGMFVVQIISSYISGSLSLLASSIDFVSDAINYGISIYVLKSNFSIKAKASILKGFTILIMGFWVAYEAFIREATSVVLPDSLIMAVISIGAISVNLVCAVLLYRSRNKDSNTYSVWICSRNDVFENMLVLAAAGLVSIFSTNIPDIIAALILVLLAVTSAYNIFRYAYLDLKKDKKNI